MKNISVAPSIIRTLVPLAVAQIVAFAATLGLTVGEDVEAAIAQTIGWVAAAVYYLAVRFLEQKWPGVGALLGWAATPDGYSRGNPTEGDYESTEGVTVGDFEDIDEDPDALIVTDDDSLNDLDADSYLDDEEIDLTPPPPGWEPRH